jgi:hypothetical protein
MKVSKMNDFLDSCFYEWCGCPHGKECRKFMDETFGVCFPVEITLGL